MSLKKNKRECPECKELVDINANYCPFCRYEFVKPVTDETIRLTPDKTFWKTPYTNFMNPSFVCSGAAIPIDMTHVFEQIENYNDKIYVTRAQYYELLRDPRIFSSYDDPKHIYYCGKQLVILD